MSSKFIHSVKYYCQTIINIENKRTNRLINLIKKLNKGNFIKSEYKANNGSLGNNNTFLETVIKTTCMILNYLGIHLTKNAQDLQDTNSKIQIYLYIYIYIYLKET